MIGSKPSTPRAGSRCSNLLIAVASTLVFLVLFESAARSLYWLRWGRRLFPIEGSVYAFPLGWQLEPGEYRGFRVNSQGFRRTGDVSLKPRADTIRVFILGGSTAFGSNGLYPQIEPEALREDTTIDHHLENLLKARHPGQHFEVINAGVPEYRLFQEFTLFREKLTGFEPALVIFLDGHNDTSFLTGAHAFESQTAPYWKNRHFERGERVLNPRSALAPAYFLDLVLGRHSYAYHSVAALLQFMANRQALMGTGGTSNRAWGDGPFELADEAALRAKHAARLEHMRRSVPLFLDQVRDLKAVAASRQIPVLYVLQPEIVGELAAELSADEVEIQKIAFAHHRDLGTLGWRVLGRDIAAELARLSSDHFLFLDLQRIAQHDSATLYTDYCHLTARGNAVVAAALTAGVDSLLNPKFVDGVRQEREIKGKGRIEAPGRQVDGKSSHDAE